MSDKDIYEPYDDPAAFDPAGPSHRRSRRKPTVAPEDKSVQPGENK